MRVDIDFKYNEPVIASVYYPDRLLFMKSELKVKIPKRPYYEPDSKYSCTEAKYLKWKGKVVDKINQAVLKSLSKELYGEIEINVEIGEHYGL